MEPLVPPRLQGSRQPAARGARASGGARPATRAEKGQEKMTRFYFTIPYGGHFGWNGSCGLAQHSGDKIECSNAVNCHFCCIPKTHSFHVMSASMRAATASVRAAAASISRGKPAPNADSPKDQGTSRCSMRVVFEEECLISRGALLYILILPNESSEVIHGYMYADSLRAVELESHSEPWENTNESSANGIIRLDACTSHVLKRNISYTHPGNERRLGVKIFDRYALQYLYDSQHNIQSAPVYKFQGHFSQDLLGQLWPALVNFHQSNSADDVLGCKKIAHTQILLEGAVHDELEAARRCASIAQPPPRHIASLPRQCASVRAAAASLLPDPAEKRHGARQAQGCDTVAHSAGRRERGRKQAGKRNDKERREGEERGKTGKTKRRGVARAGTGASASKDSGGRARKDGRHGGPGALCGRRVGRANAVSAGISVGGKGREGEEGH
ncbi:hypothetical protein FB451DRAFT_1170431 [Mycena latifolia]|nr:hypothetical protein FB451DRAFT_1170431 [Mycena latifolia]